MNQRLVSRAEECYASCMEMKAPNVLSDHWK